MRWIFMSDAPSDLQLCHCLRKPAGARNAKLMKKDVSIRALTVSSSDCL
jgi:hypothetical protein